MQNSGRNFRRNWKKKNSSVALKLLKLWYHEKYSTEKCFRVRFERRRNTMARKLRLRAHICSHELGLLLGDDLLSTSSSGNSTTGWGEGVRGEGGAISTGRGSVTRGLKLAPAFSSLCRKSNSLSALCNYTDNYLLNVFVLYFSLNSMFFHLFMKILILLMKINWWLKDEAKWQQQRLFDGKLREKNKR